MNYDKVETFRRRLQGREHALQERRGRWQAYERDLLAEREPDWEDAATVGTAVSALDSPSERERLALMRIHDAFERMERGSYGNCVSCGEPIDERRLRALPDAESCSACVMH